MGAAGAVPGWATKDPLALCPCVRSRFLDLVERAKAVGIELVVIETARDLNRQRWYKAHGLSQTLNSYHLQQPPGGKSRAFDVCPRAYLRTKQWNPGGSMWERLGEIGRALGLEWGGDWDGWKDRPHFQLTACQCEGGRA